MKWPSRLVSSIIIVSFLFLSSPFSVFAQELGEGARVYNSSDISISSSTWTYLNFDSEIRDDADFHSTVSNTTRLTVPNGKEGWYVISGHVRWSGAFTGSVRMLTINLNSAFSIVLVRDDSSESIHSQNCNTVRYLAVGDYVELRVFHDNPSAIDITSVSEYSPYLSMVRIPPSVPAHASTHEYGGSDPISVGVCGLQAQCYSTWDNHFFRVSPAGILEPTKSVFSYTGTLADCQDACWLQGNAITSTSPVTDDVLIWNQTDVEWQPSQMQITGSFTMPELITATISGTVPVIITNTWHYTETLSSGHDIAVIRSFTYGEASVAIGLFTLAAVIGLQFLFQLLRK